MARKAVYDSREFDDGGWRKIANCRGVPDPFFPPRDEREPDRTIREEIAKMICGQCAVRSQCLNYALNNTEEGIWGGTTEEERRRMKRAR